MNELKDKPKICENSLWLIDLLYYVLPAELSWVGLIGFSFLRYFQTSFPLLLQDQSVVRPVSDGRFGSLSFLSGDVFVQVSQTARHRLGYVTKLGPADDVSLQEVWQRALQRHTCFITSGRFTASPSFQVISVYNWVLKFLFSCNKQIISHYIEYFNLFLPEISWF